MVALNSARTNRSEISSRGLTKERREKLEEVRAMALGRSRALAKSMKLAQEEGSQGSKSKSSPLPKSPHPDAGTTSILKGISPKADDLVSNVGSNAGSRIGSQVSKTGGSVIGENRSNSVLSNATYQTGMTQKTASTEKNSTYYDWAKLDEYAKLMHDQTAQQKKFKTHDLQKSLREDLDKQLQFKEDKKVKDKEKDKYYHELLMGKLEDWKSKDEAKISDAKYKSLQEKISRDEQLAYDKNIKDIEHAKKRADEEQLVSRLLKETSDEKERINAKKQVQVSQMAKLLEENLKDKEGREIAKQKQKEIDNNFAKQYEKLMDDQEARKKAEMDKRLDRQKKKVQSMEQVFINNGAKDKEEDKRLVKQRKQIEATVSAKEKEKKEHLQTLRYQTQDFLIKQMGEKKQRKNVLNQEKSQTAEKLLQDKEEFTTQKQDLIKQRKQRNLKYKNDLTDQIEYSKSVQQQNMSNNEIQMNKELLKRVNRALSVVPSPRSSMAPGSP